jgi:hypothetical protein
LIVTIHQPDFAPWLGFFDRWAASDLFVVLDDVQFLRRGWHHRDRIKTANGVRWLTVPVRKKERFDQPINEAKIDNGENWRDKHLKTIAAAYGKAPRFCELFARLEEVYSRGHKLLVELNMDLLGLFVRELGIDTPVVMASNLEVPGSGSRRLADMVEKLGGDTYLTGTGSRDYLCEEDFTERGMQVSWQEYRQPDYPQLHGPSESGLSVIDYCMNTHGGLA